MPATPTAEDVLVEESRLILSSFDYATAWTLGARMQAIATRDSLPVAIEVCHGTTPVFFCLMPGATPDNSEWVRRKRAVALRFHHASLFMRLSCAAKGVDMNARYGLPSTDFVASGGSIPLRVRGVGVVGAATVSGLPDVADHALIVQAITDLGLAG
jgi:uncharacterized protein (UPF0303 family)